MVHEITVTIPIVRTLAYPIIVGTSIYDIATWFPQKKFSKIIIITDRRVKKQYGLKLQKYLHRSGYHNLLLSFPPGEKYKNHETKQHIEDAMQSHRCDRDVLIVALGGGVVGDLAGFIAATYLRGVSYIQIPTTLLAMVDSSVGGKTAINTSHGKNLIGTIYQPLCVVVDIDLLKTLSRKNIINGLIEAIKMFLTYDAKSFHYTEAHVDNIIDGDEVLLKEIVIRAIKIKAAVVSRDEQEQGERSILNFGHTIGHALEKVSNYALLHGYAVAYGIIIEATISHLLGILDSNLLLSIKNLFARLGIRGKDLRKYEFTKLIQATKIDKKVRSKDVRYILLREIGMATVTGDNYVYPVADKMVRQALKIAIQE